MKLLYPTGQRNYLRVYPTDDMQAAALATLARDTLGARTVYVVHDGEDAYGEIVAAYMRRAAANAGLDLAGTARWDPQAKTYDDLAGKVAAAGPDAVLVSGLLDSNGAAVVSAIRAALGPDVPILVPDGFTPLPRLRRAGRRRGEGRLRQHRRPARARAGGREPGAIPGRHPLAAGVPRHPAGRRRSVRRVRGPGRRGAARRDRELRRDASRRSRAALRHAGRERDPGQLHLRRERRRLAQPGLDLPGGRGRR
jgi:hypothetical protein